MDGDGRARPRRDNVVWIGDEGSTNRVVSMKHKMTRESESGNSSYNWMIGYWKKVRKWIS
ncbi:hypothetical protein Fmac_008524 [Flemingia macrophylla]|uniref:Uncharacterized protein n=1 Tax=Flemingia macrophylla TaxID=520843 RepID=A0ABD1MXQ2_9FABA